MRARLARAYGQAEKFCRCCSQEFQSLCHCWHNAKTHRCTMFCFGWNPESNHAGSLGFLWCREGESNPHSPFGPADFKSAASANFAIPAILHETTRVISGILKAFGSLETNRLWE